MNHTIEIPVEPGHHTLQVRNGRNSSSTQTFDAAEGEIVAFRCTGSRLPMHRKEVLADLSRILCRAQAGTETRSRLSRAGPPAGAAAAGPTCRYSGARSFALLPGRLLPFAGSGRSGFCSARTAPSRSDPDIRGSPRPGPGFRVDLCPRMSEQATSRGQLHRVRPGSPDTPGRQPAWSQPASPSRRAALSLRILGRISGLTSSSSKSRNQRSGVSSG
jgi:hypothetical protein